MARIVQPTPEAIADAAEIIRAGGMVAFPTETVYGLGANALDADAVARVFAAKGRPSTNPIIVHVAGIDDARKLTDVTAEAAQLAEEFWPGPLTLVMRKKPNIPSIVTAGGETVGIRVPRHPVALALLTACGLPLAAPSANRSEEVSPTLAEHVADSLGDAIDMILDGGPCEVGIESTVLDLTVSPPSILRPGTISDSNANRWPDWGPTHAENNAPAKSPGAMPRHYAPRTPVRLVEPEQFWETVRSAPDIVPVIAYNCPSFEDLGGKAFSLIPNNPSIYAEGIYRSMRQMDASAQRCHAPYILVQAPPPGREWVAIRDRLTRAATLKV